jgi:hypothetical protein
METTIIILSLLSLFQFISNLLLLSNIKKLKKDKEEKEVMMQILPGDKVTFEQGLIWQKNISFSVFYEADVVEVSNKMVKVKAYSFTSDGNLPDEIVKDKNHKQKIISFMQDQWVEREKVSQMIGKQFIRDKKINEVLK